MKRYYTKFIGVEGMYSLWGYSFLGNVYGIEVQVFAESEDRARALLKEWSPKDLKVDFEHIVFAHLPKIKIFNHEGVLFHSKEKLLDEFYLSNGANIYEDPIVEKFISA